MMIMVGTVFFWSLSGYLYCDARRTANAIIHMEESFTIYSALCSPSKVWNTYPATSTAVLHQLRQWQHGLISLLYL